MPVWKDPLCVQWSDREVQGFRNMPETLAGFGGASSFPVLA